MRRLKSTHGLKVSCISFSVKCLFLSIAILLFLPHQYLEVLYISKIYTLILINIKLYIFLFVFFTFVYRDFYQNYFYFHATYLFYAYSQFRKYFLTPTKSLFVRDVHFIGNLKYSSDRTQCLQSRLSCGLQGKLQFLN